MENKSHDLLDFMAAITQDMAREYDRIQKRATEDPGTAGDQGEENWATLLRNWIPPNYQVVTKGRILSYDGIAGPQVDVIVLHPSYPKQLLDKKLYLAGGVVAAFECKVTLKAEHIPQAMKNAAEIRRHLPFRHGSPYKHLNSSVLYGLLAHSHTWKSEKSTPIENINSRLLEADKQVTEHPREMLDLLCVADLTTWYAEKLPKINAVTYTGYSVCILNSQVNNAEIYTPIGEMISLLLNKLAWEDADIRRMAHYFSLVMRKASRGELRRWNIDKLYTKQVVERMLSERLPGEASADGWFEPHDPWDEWCAVPTN